MHGAREVALLQKLPEEKRGDHQVRSKPIPLRATFKYNSQGGEKNRRNAGRVTRINA